MNQHLSSFKLPKCDPNPTIHIVGAGGTGGYLAYFLSRLLAGSGSTIHLYDADVVELKNLKRQQFTENHLDLKKVEALRQQMKWPDAPKIITHEEYLTDSNDLLAQILMSDTTPIVISCVDNIATRKLINQAVYDHTEAIVAIDTGNNDQGGQVVIWSNQPVEAIDFLGQSMADVTLPDMLNVYPELQTIEDENPGLSTNCAEASESEPQAMLANVRNADAVALLVSNVMKNKPVVYNVYESNLSSGLTTGERKYTKWQQPLRTL